MSEKLRYSIGFILLSFVMCLKSDLAIIAVCASLGLFAFVMWSESHKESEIKKIHEQLQELRDKISTLQIAKGMGR